MDNTCIADSGGQRQPDADEEGDAGVLQCILNSTTMMPVNDDIKKWAMLLTDRLVDIHRLDKSSMTAAIEAHLRSAIFDCLSAQIPVWEKKYEEAKQRYLIAQQNGGSTAKIAKEVAFLKAEYRKRNRALSAMDQDEQGRALVVWMRERHPESLEDFFKHFNETHQYAWKKEPKK